MTQSQILRATLVLTEALGAEADYVVTFFADRRGGVAPMFALGIVPIIGFVGAAVDYSRASSTKAGKRSRPALNATGLILSREGSKAGHRRSSEQKATDLFHRAVHASRGEEYPGRLRN